MDDAMRRKVLTVSLVANVALGLLVLWLAGGSRPGIPAMRGSAPKVSTGPALAQSAQAAPSFRWSQLESTDYRTYIANLRGIGCPEQTIRDIITADVNSLYAARRRELETSTVGSLQAGLEELKQEQAEVLAVLLGPLPSPGEGKPVRRLVRQQETQVSMPLVLQEVSALDFKPRQLAAVQDVRQRFEDEMTRSGLAPTDLAYRKLWQKAQIQSDDLLQAMLGGEGYIDYELAVRRAQFSKQRQ